MTPLNEEVPIGTIVMWPGGPDRLPKTWLVCDGTEFREDDYPELALVLDRRWESDPTVDRETYFLPDLRGVFLRGVNQDRGDDYRDRDPTNRKKLTGQTVTSGDAGTYQEFEVENHNHPLPIRQAVGRWSQQVDTAGKVRGPNGNTEAYDLVNVDTILYGGAETRPVNAAVYFIIKASKT